VVYIVYRRSSRGKENTNSASTNAPLKKRGISVKSDVIMGEAYDGPPPPHHLIMNTLFRLNRYNNSSSVLS
jgi:hypothetical protein